VANPSISVALTLRKPIFRERKRMIFWSTIATSTAQSLTGATGDNRSLRMPTCVGYRPPADFSHAVLHDADLTEARICGSFRGTKLTRASLVRANLSLSDFLGPLHYEMSLEQI
jgi:uncharacterized protein YjbI with pentapeptide repeats